MQVLRQSIQPSEQELLAVLLPVVIECVPELCCQVVHLVRRYPFRISLQNEETSLLI